MGAARHHRTREKVTEAVFTFVAIDDEGRPRAVYVIASRCHARNPYHALDDTARNILDGLLEEATYAALAVVREDGTPSVTRVALSVEKDNVPVTLISDLSLHTKALRSGRSCSLLIGEPGDKGEPLTHRGSHCNVCHGS